jgi:hypothetical protein
MQGYVYVLINPAFPGLLKIGRTTNKPSERAAALSTTGVPDRFVEVHSVLAKDCIDLEVKLHEYFFDKRYADNREFFRITVEDAIEAFHLFSDLWLPRTNDRIEVSLYAYLLSGPILTEDKKDAIQKFRNRDWDSLDGSLDALASLTGTIRIGCLKSEDRLISGSQFSLNVNTIQYLESEEFRDVLTDYYRKLTGRPILKHRMCSGLLHAKSFIVSENFFEGFTNAVASEVFRFPCDTTKICFDQLTFSDEDNLYGALLAYDDLLMRFHDEEHRIIDDSLLAESESKELAAGGVIKAFKGRV